MVIDLGVGGGEIDFFPGGGRDIREGQLSWTWGGRGVGAQIDLFVGRREVQILKCPKLASSLELQPSRWSRHPRHRRRVAASVGVYFC